MIVKRSPLSLVLLIALFSLFPQAWAQEDTDDDSGEEEVSENRVTDYIELEPHFITNVGPAEGKISYLKVMVTLRASKETTRPAVEAHMSRIRHELVMLFGEQTELEKISGNEGREYLRQEAKKQINTVLEAQQTGEQIDEVLFTEFVIQR